MDSANEDSPAYWEKVLEETYKKSEPPYWWKSEDPTDPTINERTFIHRIRKHRNYKLFLKNATKDITDMDIATLRSVAVALFLHYDRWVLDSDERLTDIFNYLDSQNIDIKKQSAFSLFYLVQVTNSILDDITGEPDRTYNIGELRNHASRLLGCDVNIAFDVLLP